MVKFSQERRAREARNVNEVWTVPLSKRFRFPWSRRTRLAPLEPTLRPVDTPSIAELRTNRPEARHHLPGFQTTATDHLERGRGDPLSRQRLRFRNAFTPAQPVVDPRMFAGRSEVLQSIISAVEEKRSHVIIFGERGIGKTSLLHVLSLAAREARYIVIYFSCGATSDFSETFRTVAAEIPLLYHSAVSPVSSTSASGNSLADLLPPGKITPRQFTEAAAKLVRTRVLVMLDEFDRATSSEFRRDVAELVKTLSDLSARVQLVIAGVASDLVDLIEHIPSIRRSITALRVPAMTPDEVRNLIENGARNSGVTFQPEATDVVISAAHGSPYLTSLVCHLAGVNALGEKRQRVEASDVAIALDEAIDEFNRRMPADVAPHLSQITDLMATARKEAQRKQLAANGQAVDVASLQDDALTETIRDHLEKTGLFRNMPAEHSALLLDSLKPYVQLVSARIP